VDGCACGGGPSGGRAWEGPSLTYFSRADLESLGIAARDVVDAVEAGLRVRGGAREPVRVFVILSLSHR